MSFSNLPWAGRMLGIDGASGRGLVLVATLAAMVACGGDGGSGPAGGSAAGTYQLQEVDSYAPPVTIHHGPWIDRASGAYYNAFVVQVNGATIELNGEGRFTVSFAGAVNADGLQYPATLSTSGAYEIDGDEIALQPDNAVMLPAIGVLHRGTITLAFDLLGSGATNQYTFRR